MDKSFTFQNAEIFTSKGNGPERDIWGYMPLFWAQTYLKCLDPVVPTFEVLIQPWRNDKFSKLQLCMHAPSCLSDNLSISLLLLSFAKSLWPIQNFSVTSDAAFFSLLSKYQFILRKILTQYARGSEFDFCVGRVVI